MLYAAIDIHKRTFQAAVLDVETGETSERRFGATREELNDWAMPLQGRLAAVAIEATNGWRWVWRELSARGFDVRLVDPAQAKALRGRIKRAKTDRLDARWLCVLLAKEMLPESWLPPAEIQTLRDQTRLRKALAEDRTRWAQRLHALLTHEGWPCQRARLLTVEGRRWVGSLSLSPAARAQVDRLLRLIEAVETELRALETELRRFARGDRRCVALQTIYGVGPILACHLLAELGEAARFRRARQAVRAAGLDPVVDESGDTRRRGHLAKHGAPVLRWALVEAAQHAQRTNSPDRGLYTQAAMRVGSKRAVLTVARKIGRRAYHVLNELETQAA
jgi:transposase